MTAGERDDLPAPAEDRLRADGSRPRWRRWAALALALPLLALTVPWLRVPLAVMVIVVLLLGYFQGSLIYLPPRHGPEGRPDLRRAVEVLAYQSGGAAQQAYYIPPRQSGARGRVWLVFGGNGSSAVGWGPFVDGVPDDAAAFLLIDYPGYGANGGSPSPASIRSGSQGAVAALAAHLGLTLPEFAPRLAVFGHSLGCAAALDYAAGQPVARIVLVAPFTTMLAMARRTVGWPLCEVLVHRFDNLASLERIVAAGSPPITIIHGTADEVIPISMGRALAARWPAAIRFIAVDGADHNGIIAMADALIYRELVAAEPRSAP